MNMISRTSINQLSIDEKLVLSKISPRFVFKYRPHFMAHYHPAWVAKFEPMWMAAHHPAYMLTHRKDWLVYNAPSIVADFDIKYLIEKNPSWLVENAAEQIAYSHPHLLNERDPSLRAFHRSEETEPKKRLSLWRVVVKFFTSAYIKDKNFDPMIPASISTELEKAIQRTIKNTKEDSPIDSEKAPIPSVTEQPKPAESFFMVRKEV